MKTMRLPYLALALGTVLAGTPAEAKENFSVDSVNQPVVSADGAAVPNCPKWRSNELDAGSHTDPNYGCAINSNLAAMIADPMDLIHGKSDDTTDTVAAARAIKAWHDFEPTSKLWTTTTKVDVKGAGG